MGAMSALPSRETVRTAVVCLCVCTLRVCFSLWLSPPVVDTFSLVLSCCFQDLGAMLLTAEEARIFQTAEARTTVDDVFASCGNLVDLPPVC